MIEEVLKPISRYNPEQHKKWYEKNKEKKKEYARNYTKLHREEKRKFAREYRKRKPEVTLASMLKCNYNLTIDEYYKILSDQENKCKICDLFLDRSNKSKTPHLDHCHKTGKIRGILCHRCNLDIGVIEKENFLEKALNYLKTN